MSYTTLALTTSVKGKIHLRLSFSLDRDKTGVVGKKDLFKAAFTLNFDKHVNGANEMHTQPTKKQKFPLHV